MAGITFGPGAGLIRMAGRDPDEDGRVASPLELLFDLTFVVAFGLAGSEYAHLLAEGDRGSALFGYAFIMFGIIWAWINYAWFASAYDTDDWLYRLTTMIQMAGVVVFALGIPTFFETLHHGEVDNRLLVAGYVVMRVAMVAQWLRAAAHDQVHRRACQSYAVAIVVAQVGWVLLGVFTTGLPTFIVGGVVMLLVEAAGPVVAERLRGGTPWHPHHIAERYALLVIITLGEGVVGTIAALSSMTSEHGWTMAAVLVVVAGVSLTFGLWWAYFTIEFSHLLHRRRGSAFAFGYLHYLILVAVAVAAAGAGLHLAGYLLTSETVLSAAETVAAVSTPVMLFALGLLVVSSVMRRRLVPREALLCLGVVALAFTGWGLASLGWPAGWCLLVVAVAPFLYVLVYEVTKARAVLG